MKSKIFLVSGLLFIAVGAALAFAPAQQTADVVNWRDLVPFLIDIPGYEGGKPDGSTMTMGDLKISQAQREYTKGEQSLEIMIMDGSSVLPLYTSWMAMQNFEVDTSDEMMKKIKVEEFPGIEHIQFEDKEAEIILALSERMMVQLKGENYGDTKELKEIAGKLNLKKLAELAK